MTACVYVKQFVRILVLCRFFPFHLVICGTVLSLLLCLCGLKKVSLPLGAAVALVSTWSDRAIALAMAYGGGALLFALSVEIYAESLTYGDDHRGEMSLLLVTSVIGAYGFLW